ncbi:MAG: hypothetical protein H6867_06440 [Rhodospirillales bacterium]|nr:hypothetical protein [Rhodospirillales bacterium]MCB9995187.1 hypothetical protein [Rhodospirillales bacterium]
MKNHKEKSLNELVMQALCCKLGSSFVASVTRNKDGEYIAIKGGLIEEDDTLINDAASNLKAAWDETARNKHIAERDTHLNAGHLLSFVKPGGHIDKATTEACQIARQTNKNVMFVHNDRIITVSGPDQHVSRITVKNFYKS